MKLAPLALALALGACSGPGGIPPNVAGPGVNLAICVLTNAAADVARGMTPEAITADLLSKCGGDIATIATILDADVRAREAGGTTVAFAAIAAHAHSAADGGK